MTVEAAEAVLAGVFAGSLALMAFGGDSIVELLSSLTVLDHLRSERTKARETKIAPREPKKQPYSCSSSSFQS